MRLVSTFLFAVIGVLAQAGAPIFTHAGPLACGLRLWQPGQVQEYCYYSASPALSIVCNALHQITPVTAGSALPIAASQSCFATDVTGGNVYAVTWLVWQPIVAIPPGSTGTIQYQIAATTMPCTVNSNGACVSTAGSQPVTTMQEGSFSSGVLAAGLVRFNIENGPSTIIDAEPNAQWSFAAGPGMAVISTTGFAHAVTPSGLCAVASESPGEAGFSLDTSGAARVDWLPDGWCPSGFAGFQQPTLAGNCTSLDLTFIPQANGRCAAVPVEPVRALAQAALRFQPLTPTVQGQ